MFRDMPAPPFLGGGPAGAIEERWSVAGYARRLVEADHNLANSTRHTYLRVIQTRVQIPLGLRASPGQSTNPGGNASPRHSATHIGVCVPRATWSIRVKKLFAARVCLSRGLSTRVRF